jgi:beta-glucanase (GH16 family)
MSRRFGRAAVVSAAALLLLAVPPAVARPPARSTLTAKLVWSDEFDAPAGSAVDGSKWKYDVGGNGWGNDQLEYDTEGTDNAVQDGAGNLVITARPGSGDDSCWNGACQYTSARLDTGGRFSVKYGELQARIQIPCGKGLWPAFWALGSNVDSVGWPASGEIDMMENVGGEPTTIHGSLHGPGYQLTGASENSASYCQAFHLYAATWSSSGISFQVDGQTYASFTPASTNGNPWVFDQSFFLILNLAVGGSWPGDPDSSTQFPAQMKVDYVRVYAL